MEKIVDKEKVKKWELIVLYSNVNIVFKEFFDLYDKDRMAARLFMLNGGISESGYRVVAFKNKNIYIIVQEQIKYGVSTTLKKYKSTKVHGKYYIDTNTGMIAKSISSKFLPMRIDRMGSESDGYTVKYIKTLMPWMAFLFELKLPITLSLIHI